MESITPIRTWLDMRERGAEFFRAVRDPEQRRALLIEQNAFIEQLPPASVVRKLTPGAEPRGSAGFVDLSRQALQPVGPSRTEHDSGAGPRQHPGGRLADPAARAGDQYDLVHCLSPCWIEVADGRLPPLRQACQALGSSPRRGPVAIYDTRRGLTITGFMSGPSRATGASSQACVVISRSGWM